MEYILIALQAANEQVEVPSSRDGDFQEEHRDAPLEWRCVSFAYVRHVIGYTARRVFHQMLRIFKCERYIKSTIFIIGLLLTWPCLVHAENRDQQRKLFWQARKLLINKHYQQFSALKVKLKNYPLYPYLIFIKLKQQWPSANNGEIDEFLQTYNDTPLAVRLRAEWLGYLAKKQDWNHFIHYYQPIYGAPLQCYYLQSLLVTQQKSLAFKKIATLWLEVNSPPSVCRKIFGRWEQAGGLNSDLIWKKLDRAMTKNNLHVIQHVAQFLPSAQRQQVKRWYQVQRHPLLIEQSDQFDPDNTLDRRILLFGMKRLANKDPIELVENWSQLSKTYDLNEAEQQTILADLAVGLARRGHYAAGEWLKKIKPTYANASLREWRVRNSLLSQQWSKVLYWLDHLSRKEQQQACWRYWRARALAETQQIAAANNIYTSLAKEVDYYGVLASQRLKLNYHPTTCRIVGDRQALNKNLAIQRAKELVALGFVGEARQEWLWALNSLSVPERQAAAQLAKQWGWYDLAIVGASKAKIHNDVKLRFPFAYRRSVLAAARKTHLNSAWVWAIMRQESAFMWNAKSSAGALGLMQIMPSTGKQLARSLALRRVDLLDPEQNIRLGSIYLRQLLKLFDGNATLATASYNVGPNRIKHFQGLYQRLPKDVWVEILPWKETRDYVKSVRLARSIYNQI
ncbi:MAG: transglycosylase SLT domain-containing protein [Candidatus Aquirickettsiella sp.]